MALLNRMLKSTSRTWVALGATALILASCMIVEAFQGGKRYAFNHKVHAEELECSDCHSPAKDTGEPGMPAQPQCMLCHKAIDEKQPPERRVATLYEGKEYKRTPGDKLGREIRFAHKAHLTAELKCDACHVGIAENTRVASLPKLGMNKCTTCHETKGVKQANDCTVCHSEVRTDARPRSHGHQWLGVHGKVVRGHSEETVDRCSLCHEESSCTSCHFDSPPQSHNNYFRQRGHGVIARMDRDNCSACHRPDSCDRCHREVRPVNHSGSWGAPSATHCRSCHTPLRANECSVCHKSTPSHATAPAKPSWHIPSMNCRQCHGAGLPLPHVDNGEDCNSCHR